MKYVSGKGSCKFAEVSVVRRYVNAPVTKFEGLFIIPEYSPLHSAGVSLSKKINQ